ncbi:MAG: SMP-30/gluconolactonase/LRE family protein [Clostridia bacterium]|nr:SMP-30/gluconolactonase/LRE family protein [Clostridia bacterium]
MKNGLILVNKENSQVGEGPLWDARTETFLFLDIRGRCIWKVNPEILQNEKFILPQQIGCMAVCENGELLVALEDAVYRMLKSGELTKAHQQINIKGRRFNDGKVGPDGAFYLGTTDNNGQGAFYRLRDGELVELFDKCSCSNGLDWTNDKKHMYYIDTPKQQVEIFDFDVKNGTLSNRRKFMDIPVEWGCPDGMCLDENDDLWIALWDGNKVIHIDKSTKEIVDEIWVPCPKASCCAFGGRNLNELYITTAAMTDFHSFPQAGNTFKTVLGVKGKPINYYKY